jgi:hypothetical protein
MGESLRDFRWQMSAVTAGGAMIGADNPETLRRSRVAQVLYRNGVTSCTAAIRIRQPHPKPGGQQISFPPKLLAVSGLAPLTDGLSGFRVFNFDIIVLSPECEMSCVSAFESLHIRRMRRVVAQPMLGAILTAIMCAHRRIATCTLSITLRVSR